MMALMPADLPSDGLADMHGDQAAILALQHDFAVEIAVYQPSGVHAAILIDDMARP